MKRDLGKWSLVCAGKWNTAILSPDWLAKNVFKQDTIQIMYPVLGGGDPIFESDDMRIIVTTEKIVFVPLRDDPELLRQIETNAKYVLDTLGFTPVTAFGENFCFSSNTPPQKLESMLSFTDTDQLDDYGKLGETAIRRTLDMDDYLLNLSIISGNEFRIELNYHYNAPDANTASRVMSDTYLTNRNHGLEMLKSLYDLTLDEEEIE